jgi:hypothetical protein
MKHLLHWFLLLIAHLKLPTVLYYILNECARVIWIVVSQVPEGEIGKSVHHALELAQEIEYDADVFKHECVFEW